MSAVIVTAKYADALVDEAPNAGLIATKLADGRVRVESHGGDTPEGLAEEMWEYAYRFGTTKVERDHEEREPLMPEYEKCWACVQIVHHYPGPVTMSALSEVQGQDIGLCDRHWSWWLAYWMSPETGEPGCSAHVVDLPPPLRPIAFVNSEGNAQVVTDDKCPACGYPERHRVYRGESVELIADGCPSCETPRLPERASDHIDEIESERSRVADTTHEEGNHW